MARRRRFPRPLPPPPQTAAQITAAGWTPAPAGPGKDEDVIRLSWDAFLTDCERMPGDDWDGLMGSVRTGNDSWIGSASWEHAMSLARGGWTEGRDKMIAGLSVIADTGPQARSHRLDVAGAYPVAAMAAAGDMQCMVDSGFDVTPRKIHRIIVSLSTSGKTSADCIINRGVAICAMVDAIEAGDDRCEIFGHFASQAGGCLIDMLLELKAADQPLEVDRIAFAIAHPSMLRRLLFRQIELRGPASTYSFTYGLPVNAGEETARGAVYFPSMGIGAEAAYGTPEAALATVKAAMAHHGVEIAGGDQ